MLRPTDFWTDLIYTSHIYISGWKCGCSSSARTPAASYSVLGLVPVQKSHWGPAVTPRCGFPHVAPPARHRWPAVAGCNLLIPVAGLDFSSTLVKSWVCTKRFVELSWPSFESLAGDLFGLIFLQKLDILNALFSHSVQLHSNCCVF